MSSKAGKALLELGKARLKAQWKDLEARGREDFEAALKDYGDLLVRAAAGEDVEHELKLVESTIDDWTWIGASYAKRVALEILHEATKFAGNLLTGASERLAGRL